VSYSSDYNVNDRDVYLSGEAYFEVASGNELPFVVHAYDLKVTAL
jgi:ferric-dicitrate binding protein FerR (iron transport regulator)